MTGVKPGGASSTPERLTASEYNALLKKSPKYQNQKVTVNGITFHSQAEAMRWDLLQTWQKAGAIRDLQRQVPIILRNGERPLMHESGRTICLVVDFRYTAEGNDVLEDVKGFITDAAAIKTAIARSMGYDVRFLKWSRGQGWQRVKVMRSRRRRGRS